MKKNIRFSKTLIIRLLVILILISALMIMIKIESGFLVYSNGAKTLDMQFGYNAADVVISYTYFICCKISYEKKKKAERGNII